MGTVVVRNSVAKRVIVTLMPAISFLCMLGIAGKSARFHANQVIESSMAASA